MYVHSLDAAVALVARQFSRNPSSRPSAMFRRLRRSQQLQVFGDYPLLYTMFCTTSKLGVRLSRTQIRHAINQSSELATLTRGERSTLVDLLEDCSRPDSSEARIITSALSDGDGLDEDAVAAVLQDEPAADDELDDAEEVDDADLEDEDAEPAPARDREPGAVAS